MKFSCANEFQIATPAKENHPICQRKKFAKKNGRKETGEKEWGKTNIEAERQVKKSVS